ncbi:amidase [Ensifer sp. NM-2]|uniref:amidase n=1 Tax=Ensifer sp. NM-2 TaxID=2109730 RepID=UPI001304B8B4|nr:amidase [Ensifer sp. NM-2]
MDDLLSSMTAARVAITRRDVSVEALTSRFLSIIADSNSVIGAVRSVAADEALEAARAMDIRLEAGGSLAPLAGMPVIVKENCDTAGMACSAGLPFRAGHVPAADAPVVRRLRELGAIILGVSVSDPGAFGVRTAEVTHPCDATLTVGGSSGGSAAALAAGYCLGALGTDTGGSIRIPSACCGTVGLKPSFGRLPMEGIYPLIPSLDHVGPMARTVEDVRLMWDALSNGGKEGKPVASVGFDPRWVEEADHPVADAFAAALDDMRRAGVDVRKVSLPRLHDVLQMHGRIFFLEGVAYHRAHFPEAVPHYPAMARQWFDLAWQMPASDYIEACENRVRFTREVDRVLGDVDLILTPALSVSKPRRDATELLVAGQSLDFTLAMVRQTCLFNHTGHPALVMPMREENTVCGGLQIVGRNGEENRILTFANMLEFRAR